MSKPNRRTMFRIEVRVEGGKSPCLLLLDSTGILDNVLDLNNVPDQIGRSVLEQISDLAGTVDMIRLTVEYEWVVDGQSDSNTATIVASPDITLELVDALLEVMCAEAENNMSAA